MSNNLSNIFQKGTPRSGSLQGPTQTSQAERNIGGVANQENAALLLSGGSTSSLFFAGASKITQGIAGLSRAKSAFASARGFKFDAKSAEITGRANAAEALERLNDVQAANIVAAFASGIRLQGSVTAAQIEVASQADFSRALSKANAALVAGGKRRKASEAEDFARRTRSAAKTDIIVGAVTVAASLFL